MSLNLKITNDSLELQDKTLVLQLNFHQSLQLLNAIDQALASLEENNNEAKANELETLEIIKYFYSSLVESLMLLGTRDRQLFLSDASPSALTCLMYLFKGKPAEQLLRDNLSQRRINQIEDELNYFKLDLNKLLDEFLLPFFTSLNHRLKEKEITLQDPKGIYFKANY